ncbi:MAG: phosphopantetheine-binding protein, partial [Burkholderiales bacterium]
EQLAAIFAKVLKLDQVGIRDNFFDLGGHSFLVLRVLAEIEKACGRRLSVATLFQAPTVEEIAGILSAGDSFDESDVIVPLNPHGTTPPLFSVWMGIATELRELCRSLGPEQRFYGINSHWDPAKMRMTRIEEMAAYNLTHLCKVQPHGPYHLSSDCVSTLIVLEIAQQLLAEGEEVAALILIDPPAPKTWIKASKAPTTTVYRNRVRNYLRSLGKRNAIDQFASLSMHALNAIWGRIALYVCKALGLPLSHGVLSRYIFYAHLKARDNYVPKAYAGRIWFIWASGNMDESKRREIQNAWSRLAARSTHRTVPGAHDELFKEPYVRPLAEEMKICLAEARSVPHANVEGDALGNRRAATN